MTSFHNSKEQLLLFEKKNIQSRLQRLCTTETIAGLQDLYHSADSSPEYKGLYEELISSYILKKMPCDALTDMTDKLCCIKQFMHRMNSSDVLRFCLKNRDKALKDFENYTLLYTILDKCEPSQEIWKKAFFEAKSDRSIVLEFEKLLDEYVYLPSRKTSEEVINYITVHPEFNKEVFVSRIQLLNTLHVSHVLPLTIPKTKIQPLVSIQNTLSQIEERQMQIFESEVILFESSLWTGTKKIGSYDFCCFQKIPCTDLDEVLSSLLLVNLSTVVKVTACLLCSMPSDKDSQLLSTARDKIERAWACIYSQMLEDVFFENLSCEHSFSGQTFLRTAACLMAYRARFGLKQPFLFQKAWAHASKERSIYMKCLTETEERERFQKDTMLLEQAVCTSILVSQ
ncbi:hypothetical protein BY458DRAFT_502354 [Sporodiniella umbellata]|nr:hypothetical protein BY458DRAFT_502354 [Sporodiniella umbellata]